MTRRTLAVVGVLAAAVPASGQYRMIDLRTVGGSFSKATAINDRGQIVGRANTMNRVVPYHAVLWNPLPVITALEASAPAGVRVALTAVPPTSATTYHLGTADSAGGPWSVVPDATLTELEPDRYQFTVPFDPARGGAFWRVIETVA